LDISALAVNRSAMAVLPTGILTALLLAAIVPLFVLDRVKLVLFQRLVIAYARMAANSSSTRVIHAALGS
jgi:hypothetical protein